jgi:hypothetical protein
VFLLFFLAAIGVQIASGGYAAPFNTPDAPSQFLSGLFVRDYLRHGIGTAPMAYAREYYAHYPKLAIGNWPPAFYGVEALWMLVLPTRPGSVLVLIALLMAAVSYMTFRVLRPRLGTGPALFGAGILLLMSPMPDLLQTVMLEVPLTCFVMFAVLSWARFLARGRARDVALFGLATALAVLTKGNALFLVLVPPLSIAISGRWDLLRSRVLWYAVGAVALLAGPWTVHFLGTSSAGWVLGGFSAEYLTFIRYAVVFYLKQIPELAGLGFTAVALLGLWSTVIRGRDGDPGGVPLWSSAAAAVAGALALHVLVPAGTALRHLLPAYPYIAMFAAAGTATLARWIGRRVPGRTLATALSIGVVLAVFAFETRDQPRDRGLVGMGAVADAALRDADLAGGGSVSLIASDAWGEGCYVVEVAVRDPRRPGYTVWRGTKLLSSVRWSGAKYALRAHDDAALLDLLDRAGVGTVVLDRSTDAFPHLEQLAGVIAAHPERFVLQDTVPIRRYRRGEPGGMVEIYHFVRETPLSGARLRQVPSATGVEPVGDAEAR